MKKTYNFFVILTAVLLYFLSGCDYKPQSIGSDRQIFVIADSLLWLDVKDEVENAFHSYVYTPRSERSFILSRRSLDKLSGVKTRKNLMFIGTTDTQNAENDYLSQLIPQEFKDDVENNRSFYFFKDDLYVAQQINLIMVATDTKSFIKNFSLLKDDIFKRFNEKYFSRLKAGMFEIGQQFELEEFLVKNYGYKVNMQHDYFIANQDPAEKFVWIRRLEPDRWISIWRINEKEVAYTSEALFAIRNEMTQKYYDGDYIVKDETSLSNVLFRGQQTTKITGTWRNDSLIVGGPFRTYIVPKKDENSVYFIDIAVMAPARDKKPYLDQLEVIAHTFEFVKSQTSK